MIWRVILIWLLGASLARADYTYDHVSDLLSLGDGVYSGAASASLTNIAYDDLHRVTSLTRPATSQTSSFNYSSIGNVISNSENGAGAYGYGTRLPHAVTAANGTNYSYDQNGNMLTRGGQELAYDPENRLTLVVMSNSTVAFGYDANGARLWKQGAATNSLQVWIDGIYEEKDGKILYHVLAGDRIVCTFDSAGVTTEYYHPDELHSTAVETDSSGNPYQHYEYSAFGQSRYTSSSTAFPVSKRYASQVLDEETGLYYYGCRYYDPQLGRFVQPDSMIPDDFNPQSYDRYAYSLNNPLKYVDPDGHSPWWYSLPLIGPGIVNIQGGFARRAMAEYNNYTSYQQMASELHLGSETVTAGDVSAVRGVQPVTKGAANMYVTGAQEIATARVGTGATIIGMGERTEATETAEGAAEATRGTTAAAEGNQITAVSRYSDIPNPKNVAAGKDFTRATKQRILQKNNELNGGINKSDKSGTELVPSQKSQSGVTPPSNEAQIDHIIPKTKGGNNSPKNAQVLSREENRIKSDN